MDLPLFVRVLARHRFVVGVGFALAVVVALLSYARPALDGIRPAITYREEEEWQSSARVLLSVPSLPGRTLDERERLEARLPSLAVLYAGLTTGDEVKSLVLREGAVRGKVVAAAATATGGTATLPIVEITAVAPSARGSRDLANRYAGALISYVRSNQIRSRVSREDRIGLGVLNRAGQTELAVPRSKTIAIIAFLALLSATVGVAFALENARTRGQPATEDAGHEFDAEPVSRVPAVVELGSTTGEPPVPSEEPESVRRWA